MEEEKEKTDKRTHRTVRLSEQIFQPCSLAEICLKFLTKNSQQIVSVQGLEKSLALQLLKQILLENRLTFQLAKVFIACGHADISEAISSLNLIDAVPLALSTSSNEYCRIDR
ncbi:unnamed protein product [Heterosigma akashiwo]